jgi:hypothetical protein
MGLSMQHEHGHAACTGTLAWAWTNSMYWDMQHGHENAALTCQIDIEHGYSQHLLHGHTAWTWASSMDMDMDMQH